ncbi:hypothetical protein PsYK624_124610 [Phanerochaete sordida]|uniref:Uncharacterized protein n=1 Tax=Phanerochaete sordida TaxID=48140 RepID=A0A9P3LJI9_9APHY|nr:hypothetical protein PsYK624_124610 [Phanerochaete sordida]
MDDTSQFAVAAHLPTATWRPNPGVRGTFEIITTCLSTLIICVWSAVHVDVPLRRSARVNGIGKVGWIFTGLVSPDLLLYAACCQLYRAQVLLQDAQQYLHGEYVDSMGSRLRRCCDYMTGSQRTEHAHSKRLPSEEDIDSKESSEPVLVERCEVLAATSSRPSQATRRRRNSWTLTHAFYGVMGGFVLETSSSILEGERRFVLTLSGLRFVLEHAPDLLPDLSVRDIQLKGRSDVLAKTLLILQLLNFCVSCAARRAQSLPLSLLEVFTLAHALCTVITCIIWWKKPFGVLEPTYITGDRADELAAYMLFTSPMHKDYFAGLVCGTSVPARRPTWTRPSPPRMTSTAPLTTSPTDFSPASSASSTAIASGSSPTKLLTRTAASSSAVHASHGTIGGADTTTRRRWAQRMRRAGRWSRAAWRVTGCTSSRRRAR